MKILYFDVETTGLSWKKNDIVQLAVIVEINGEIKRKRTFEIKPTNWDNISEDALRVNRMTIEKLKTFPEQSKAFFNFKLMLGDYVDKFNPSDKFVLAGYNIASFDIKFLREWWKRNEDKYYGSWFYSNYYLDVMHLTMFRKYFNGNFSTKSMKLIDVAKALDVVVNSVTTFHDAKHDVEVTREIFKKLTEVKDGCLFCGNPET